MWVSFHVSAVVRTFNYTFNFLPTPIFFTIFHHNDELIYTDNYLIYLSVLCVCYYFNIYALLITKISTLFFITLFKIVIYYYDLNVYIMLYHITSYYVMLCHIMLECYVMLQYVVSCHVMLCYVMLCYLMICYDMLCHVML